MKTLLKNTVFAISLSISAIGLMAVPMVSVQAAIPTDASLLKLIEVTKVGDTMSDMSSNKKTTEQIMQSVLASLSNDNLSQGQRQRLNEIIDKYSKEMMDGDNQKGSMNQEIINIYIKSAKQYFNQKEVDAQIAFYSSDVGKSIVEKQPAMMRDYSEKAMPIFKDSIMRKVQDIMPRMIAEIEALEIKK